jgi:hypothetical protein
MWWIDRSEKKEEEEESFFARVDHDLALALPGCSYFTKPKKSFGKPTGCKRE